MRIFKERRKTIEFEIRLPGAIGERSERLRRNMITDWIEIAERIEEREKVKVVLRFKS